MLSSSLQEGPRFLIPCTLVWTSGLQNRERINVCVVLSRPVWWQFVTAAAGSYDTQ